jgi:hypothetical protein
VFVGVGDTVIVTEGVLVGVVVFVGVLVGVVVFVGVLVGVRSIQLLISQPNSSIIDIQYDTSDNTDGNSNENGKSESVIVEIN